ncbi:MAG: protein phosphatase 2C domain-containing protein [Lachnospiraceae bacterium]|nr:protein phosphatase 2C domain-containing protein [Lachnospiraceae bacterium]
MITGILYDKGDRAPVNQDALCLESVLLRGKKELSMAVVCDGVGSLDQGERISAMIASQMRTWFYGEVIDLAMKHKLSRNLTPSMTRMLHGIARNCRQITAQEKITLGSTMSAVIICGHRGYVYHAGDSRIYLIRKTTAQRISTDDVRNGCLSACIGSGQFPHLHTRMLRLRRSDGVLLCSDGFYRMLDQEALCGIMDAKKVSSERQLSSRLLSAAMLLRSRGEQDNISALALIVGKEQV